MKQFLLIPGKIDSYEDIDRIIEVAQSKKLNPVRKYPLFMKIYWFRSDRRESPHEIAENKKYILEGLRQAGIFKTDWKHINSFIDKFIYTTESNHQIIEIIELGKSS